MRNWRSAIRAHVVHALLSNRTPGLHFPGYFLDLDWRTDGRGATVQSMPVSAHCADVHGAAHIGAIGVMLDTGLALPNLKSDPFSRHATVHLAMQFRDAVPCGDIRMKVETDGITKGAAVKRTMSSGLLSTKGMRAPFCRAFSGLVSLPRPASLTLGELKKAAKPVPGLHSGKLKLDKEEEEVLAACDRALSVATPAQSFIGHFWNFLPQVAKRGAICRPKVGPHMRNRVGHVHGGILLGWAADTASAAIPGYPFLSTFAASFIRPGTDSQLTVRSRVSHAGRSFAVVHTEIKNMSGACLFEALSHHAANRGPLPAGE